MRDFWSLDSRAIEPPGDEEEGAGENSRWSAILSMVIILIGTIILFITLPLVEPSALNDALRIFLVLVAGMLPVIIYSSFASGRLPTLFEEYKQNLRRLGFPHTAGIYQRKFEQNYGQKIGKEASPLSETPILIAALLSTVGWFLALVPIEGQTSGLVPNQTPIAYGFLGAYVFGLGALVRQYLMDDLQPRYYASLTNRFLTVFILSWLVTLLLGFINIDNPLKQDAILVVAFFFGLFPTAGLRLIQRVSSQLIGTRIEGFKELYPLSKLDGLNAFQEDRLLLEGIESLQNLACANIVDLMLKTRYPIEQLVDWIDQALLHLHARILIEEFQESGYRNATDFLDAYEIPGPGSVPPDPSKLEAWHGKMADLLLNHLSDNYPVKKRKDLVTLFDTIAAALKHDPNMFHIRYWRVHEYEALPEDVERTRASADLKLMEGLPTEAAQVYDEVLSKHPQNHTTRLYRGMAFLQSKDYERAIQDFVNAVELGGLKWENIRLAYFQLARAHMKQEGYQKAKEYYLEALKLDRDFVEAHMDLAFVQLTQLQEYEEAIEHLGQVIEANYKKAEALASRGLARYWRWMQRNKPRDETGMALIHAARDDLKQAIRLDPSVTPAYVNLAIVYNELQEPTQMLSTLNDGISTLEQVFDQENAYQARQLRGTLNFNRKDYAAAELDYQSAADLATSPEKGFKAFYNLGLALRSQGKHVQAIGAYQQAAQRQPASPLTYQELGDLYSLEGDPGQAESAYANALRVARAGKDQRAEALAHLGLGKLYHGLPGRETDARRELELARENMFALEEDLHFTEATFELGLLSLAAREFGQAISHLNESAALFEVLEKVRASVYAYYNLGNAYLQAGNKDAALNAASQARDQLARVFMPGSQEDIKLQGNIELLLGEAQD